MLSSLSRLVLAVVFPVGLAALGSSAMAADPRVVHVTKTATCGCCAAWVEHIEKAGFDVVVRDVPNDALDAFKRSVGIAAHHRSCHTALVEDYVIEGHVDAREIARLLEERPDALGLAVPGMPLGSPGMDFGTRRQRYETLLLTRDGQERVFARHEE